MLAPAQKQPGERQAQPERDAAGRDEDRRHVTAEQRIGALADVDAADVEGQPDAGAGDAQQRDGGQRVIEVAAAAERDQPGHEDEDCDEKQRRC